MDRRSNPARPENWALRCSECGRTFTGQEKEMEIRRHFDQVHDRRDVAADRLWVGKGGMPLDKPRAN